MSDTHKVWASSFADPEDVRRFRKCQAEGGYWNKGKWHPGGSDQNCFNVGDNAIGAWQDDCSEGSGPSCALPPEVMEYYGLKHLDRLLVTHLSTGQSGIVLIKDHMPHISTLEAKERANPNRKPFRIDLNPDACHMLGISIPAEALVTWRKA